jgi:hypothetical protein
MYQNIKVELWSLLCLGAVATLVLGPVALLGGAFILGACFLLWAIG